jgi:hypothetical protein
VVRKSGGVGATLGRPRVPLISDFRARNEQQVEDVITLFGLIYDHRPAVRRSEDKITVWNRNRTAISEVEYEWTKWFGLQ